jgi:Fur family transcriptional regulator, ferric uptake regulator
MRMTISHTCELVVHAMDPAEHFRGYLKEKGLTLTAARSAILEGIVASKGHFDADELHGALKGRGVSAATIYRALPLFVKSGILRETLRARGRSRYEPAWGRDHHDHLECLSCGRLIEFKDDALEALQDRVCRRHGFRAVEHRLGIRGYCRACIAAGKERRA